MKQGKLCDNKFSTSWFINIILVKILYLVNTGCLWGGKKMGSWTATFTFILYTMYHLNLGQWMYIHILFLKCFKIRKYSIVKTKNCANLRHLYQSGKTWTLKNENFYNMWYMYVDNLYKQRFKVIYKLLVIMSGE